MSARLFILVGIVALVVSSCDKKSREDAWQRGNLSGLEKDIKSVLAKNGIPQPANVRCFMSKTTRDGACELTAPSGELDLFEKSLDMVAANVPDSGLRTHPDPTVCPAESFAGASVFASVNKAKHGYDYVYLFRTPTKACVQIRYGWG